MFKDILHNKNNKAHKLYVGLSSFVAIMAIACSVVVILHKIAPPSGEVLANAVSSLDELETLNYTEDKTVFPNPERGYYQPFHSENITNGDISGLRSQNVSLILVETNLAAAAHGDYRVTNDAIKNAPLSSEKLKEISDMFALARNNGLKVIFRAAYTLRAVYGAEPPVESVMLGHIAQIGSVLKTNEDVLYSVQAGFLGAWGEWHSTVYGDVNTGNGVPYKYNDIPLNIQKDVTSALLAAVPKSRMIQIREPRYIRAVNGGVTINDATAFNGSDVSRIGFHNDGMFYDQTDDGTYGLDEVNGAPTKSRADELAWMNTQTKYMPYGGETNGSPNSFSTGENTVSELTKLHAQYLNTVFSEPVISNWQATTLANGENAYSYIGRSLGYKYLLTDAQISSKVYSGGALHLKLDIRNDGFGNLINERNCEIILSNSTATYKVKINEDIRKWYRENGLMTKDLFISLPSSIALGSYNVYVNFPDKSDSLSGNPMYSIRLANNGVWDAKTGYNLIKAGLVISDGGLVNSSNNTFSQIDRVTAEGLLGVVTSVSVTGVSLDKTSSTMDIGQNITLSATVLPTNATVKNVTFTSSNTSVATVDNSGKVTSVSPGKATITVTTVSGGMTATSVITVNAPAAPPISSIPVSSVSLSPTTLGLANGATYGLTTTILPANATNKSVSYVSANPAIVSVDNSGKLTAISAGNTTIKVTSVGSGVVGTMSVNVTQPVVSVSLPTQALNMVVGTTYSLAGSVNPSTATNPGLTYASSDNSIATVGTDGTVNALAAGNVTITATSTDGGKTATCAIIVTQAAPVVASGDWSKIDPISQRSTGNASTMKAYNNQTTLYLLVNGSSLKIKSQFYLNTDNNDATGLKTVWDKSGIEYLVENGTLYKYSGSNNRWSWSKVGAITLTKKDSLIGVAVPLSKMNLTIGSTIHVGFLSNDNTNNMLPAKSFALPAYTLGNATNQMTF